MMRRLQIVMAVGSCLGVIGMCASESSTKLVQSQPHCQRVQTHDTATYHQSLESTAQDLDALNQVGYEQLKEQNAQAAMAQRHSERSIATFQQALNLARHDIEKIEVYRGLGEAYLIAQTPDLAEEAFLNGLRLELPSSSESSLQAQAAFRTAMIHYHRCDWEAAIASFREAYPFLESNSHWQNFYLKSLTYVYDWSVLQDYFAEHHRQLEEYELLNIGHEYAAQLKQEDALAVYHQFSQQLPFVNDTSSSRELLTQYFLGEGLGLGAQYDEAEHVLQNVHQALQDNPAARADIPPSLPLSLSTVWVHQNQFDNIEALWSDLYPEPSIRDLKLGQFYLSVRSPQNTLDLAHQWCEQSIQTRPSAEAYQCLGDVAFNTKQYEAAIASYVQAYALGNSDVLNNLSNSYKKLEQYDQAIETTQSLIQITSGYYPANAYRKLAHLYLKQQQWQFAQNAYERSYQTPNSTDDNAIAIASSRIEYGQALIADAEYDRAIAACEFAAAGLPQSPSPLICLGDAYRHKGELDQALNYLEQAQPLLSSAQNHQSVTVSAFYQHGDLQSLELLQEYWPRMAMRAEFNETLGEILLAQQQYQIAALTFKTALYEYPLSTRASLGLGQSLIAQEKYGGAIAVLNRYLKLDPENTEAQDLLQEANRL
ncbi:MAG: tetratricopeptide repeat protein [Cyanobacteria bacterium P01_F01_bin.150]